MYRTCSEMDYWLRTLKNKQKGLGGRGKLIEKVINKLTLYYGLSIRRHYDSIEDMKSAIMATFYHYSSSHKNPNHRVCVQKILGALTSALKQVESLLLILKIILPYLLMLYKLSSQFMKVSVMTIYFQDVLVDSIRTIMGVSTN